MRVTQEMIQKLPPGVRGCRADKVGEYLPLWIQDIIDAAPVERSLMEMTADVKVHMLMPGFFPCIPGWHYDFLPRNPDKSRIPLDKDYVPSEMFMWLSNEPLTVFKDTKHAMVPQEWSRFTTLSCHKGVVAEEHIWRMLIRLVPTETYPLLPEEEILTKHAQIYLTDERFKW